MTRRFLVRIDDFPAWDENCESFIPELDFLEFHAILSSRGIPYLLAVTPQPSLKPVQPGNRKTRPLSGEECRILRQVSNEGVFIALHGVTHQTRSKAQYSEFSGLGALSFCERIQYGATELKRQTGLSAEVFVPPFNRISEEQLNLLATRFRVICGGPESARHLNRQPLERLPGGSIYLPSHYPFYGRASEIQGALESDASSDPVCLTLHWEWERRKNYAGLDSFCESIRPRVLSWKDFLNESSI